MNIKYKGASKETNNKRFAIITFAPDDAEKAERFVLLLNEYCYNSTKTVDNTIEIPVENKEDYDYIKYCFKSYKETKIFDKKSKYSSYEAMYETAADDGEMYCYLVNEGCSESSIKRIMEDVSCGPDAYPNALSLVASEIF